jgi:biotin carboxyl carrier protein
MDILRTDDAEYHVLDADGAAFRVNILSHDVSSGTMELRVNGISFQARMTDRLDRLVQDMGLKDQALHKVRDVKAPMPGLVLQLLVEPGQQVAEGDPLLILEAMKMENVIKSPGTGLVKAVLVERGQALEKGQSLVEMD